LSVKRHSSDPNSKPGGESTFDFCFEGIEKGSVVAVSTYMAYMASEHGNKSDQKEWSMAGYNEMLRRIEPEKFICYNTPFPEMQGDVVYVDHERSPWKFLNYERFDRHEDLDSFKIGGQTTDPHDIMASFIDVPTVKGGDSAYGGKWKPAKPGDGRFLGKPGEIKQTHSSGKRGGYDRETKIGDDGRATIERHHTDHDQPSVHSDPHDHISDWSEVLPKPGPPISNPDGAPEFKRFVGVLRMSYDVGVNSLEDKRFKTISDFKWCMKHGREVQFDWKGVSYCCFECVCQIPGAEPRMIVSQAGTAEVNRRTERWCDTADELIGSTW